MREYNRRKKKKKFQQRVNCNISQHRIHPSKKPFIFLYLTMLESVTNAELTAQDETIAVCNCCGLKKHFFNVKPSHSIPIYQHYIVIFRLQSCYFYSLYSKLTKPKSQDSSKIEAHEIFDWIYIV